MAHKEQEGDLLLGWSRLLQRLDKSNNRIGIDRNGERNGSGRLHYLRHQRVKLVKNRERESYYDERSGYDAPSDTSAVTTATAPTIQSRIQFHGYIQSPIEIRP